MQATPLVALALLSLVGTASAFLGTASAFLSSPLSALHPRLHARASTVSQSRLPHLAKGLRMTIAMPPLSQLDDLDGKIPDCPNTIWNADRIDIAAEQVSARASQPRAAPSGTDLNLVTGQAKYKAEGIPESPHYIVADETANAMGYAWFEVNKDMIMDRLRKHGAILFRSHSFVN